jgi:hypothetical protein
MDVNENGVLSSTLDDYLRKRLKPVEGAIPHLPGIEMLWRTISGLRLPRTKPR